MFEMKLSESQAEMSEACRLWERAKEEHTVPNAQIEALSILLSSLQNTKAAIHAAETFDIQAVSLEERDFVEVTFGFLSSLKKYQ